jgi:cysteinyl-tRNA synthetase
VIRLHDTLAREKREFVPLNPERITMYVCGPTVYGRAHIGNARPAVVFDTLARLIRHEFGENSLVYARNVTDVDDKIIAAAEAEGVEPAVITERYERFYLEDMGALGVGPPDIAPHATQEIGPMVAMIERLVEQGNAYEAEGHVLFSVASDPDYGVLSRRDRDSMIAGARVEIAPYKRDPADFVLWKPSPEGVIGWDSPWGRGRPGWHVECSAMIERHLGETIDIHGGGLDLIFPHHENEIAQSRCAHDGAPLARFWVHNGFVDMGAEKMSKSLGNIVTPAELLAHGHRGETLRLALLSAHYRSPLPWTEALVSQAKTNLDKLYRMASDAEPGSPDAGVVEALQDDLNTPLALTRLMALEDPSAVKCSAQLLGLLRQTSTEWFKAVPTEFEKHADQILLRDLFEALRGIGQKWELLTPGEMEEVESSFSTLLEIFVPKMIEQRNAARAQRDFTTADEIRNDLSSFGIVLEDGPGGTTWRRE